MSSSSSKKRKRITILAKLTRIDSRRQIEKQMSKTMIRSKMMT
jgi:hypothetical protein